MKNIIRLHSNLLLASLSLFLFMVSPPEILAGWKSDRENLDQVFIHDDFRIFYTLKGDHALKDTADTNDNKVPDIVENVAIQLEAANHLYKEVFGFIPPLESRRYRGRIEVIDVHIMSSKFRGESGDGVIKYKYKTFKGPAVGALTITISNAIKAGNLTPSHELTHSYMNGSTMFKNRWLTEGVARWMEYVFKKGTGKEKKLPDSPHDFYELLQKTYDAKYFWNRLLHICSSVSGPIDLPQEVKDRTYVGTNQKVVAGNDLHGIGFMKLLFDNLDRFDDVAGKQRGLKTFRWKESEQKSPENNKYILMALKKTIRDTRCDDVPEIKEFLHLTDLYIEGKLSYEEEVRDLTPYLEDMGNPFKEAYRNGEESYARNIWEMQVFNKRLFLGAGNSNNSGPVPNAGPVPIFSFNPENGIFSMEGQVDDEQINIFTEIGGHLYVPGADATESHRYGNFYVRKQDGSWKKSRNIPRALHVFDMTEHAGILIAGISTKDGAAVAISENKGKDWNVEQIGYKQRTYSVLVIDNILYAIKQFLPQSSIAKWPADRQEEYFGVAELDEQGRFIARYDLTENSIFPDTLLDKRYKKRITRSLHTGGKALYIGAYNFKRPFGFYVARSLGKDTVDVKRIKIPWTFKPRDFFVREEKIYLLCSQEVKNKHVHYVLETTFDNPDNYRILFTFSHSTFARSFEEIDGDFYFGMGSEIRSSKKWSMDEISPDTGMIIRLRKKNMN